MSRWPMVPLGEIATLITRPITVEPTNRYRTLGVRWWGEGAYERQTIDGCDTVARTLSLVQKDDLIINKIWVRHGSIAIASDAVDGCAASNEFPTFVIDRAKAEPRWLHWLAKTRWFWAQCDALSSGTSGKNRIKPERFLGIRVPVAPLAQQRRVVAYIDSLAAKIRDARQLSHQCASATAHVTPAAAFRVFEGLNHHALVSLGTLGAAGENPVQTGPFGAQLHKSEFTERGVPVLNVGNVWPEGLRLDRLDHVTETKAKSLARYRLQGGDLLFARSGATLGKVCIVPRECDGWLMTGHLFRVRFDPRQCVPQFAFLALRAASQVRSQVFEQVRGATRPGFNTTLLSKVQIPVPPLDEQHRIVAHFERVQAMLDQIKRLQESVDAELAAMLPAVLHRVFNGDE